MKIGVGISKSLHRFEVKQKDDRAVWSMNWRVPPWRSMERGGRRHCRRHPRWRSRSCRLGYGITSHGAFGAIAVEVKAKGHDAIKLIEKRKFK